MRRCHEAAPDCWLRWPARRRVWLATRNHSRPQPFGGLGLYRKMGWPPFQRHRPACPAGQVTAEVTPFRHRRLRSQPTPSEINLSFASPGLIIHRPGFNPSKTYAARVTPPRIGRLKFTTDEARRAGNLKSRLFFRLTHVRLSYRRWQSALAREELSASCLTRQLCAS